MQGFQRCIFGNQLSHSPTSRAPNTLSFLTSRTFIRPIRGLDGGSKIRPYASKARRLGEWTTYEAWGKIVKVTKMKSPGHEAIATCFGKSQSLRIEDTFA